MLDTIDTNQVFVWARYVKIGLTYTFFYILKAYIYHRL